MTVCDDCGKEYRSADTCTFRYVILEGKTYEREGVFVPGSAFGGAVGDPGRCDDCGVVLGRIHHAGCTLERCPRCGEALATCACDGGETAYEKEA